MMVGYARVSTSEQNLDLQIEALKKAGCEKIFTDKVSSVKHKQGLNEAIEFVRQGDSLVVWKLDRLCRSVKDLIDISSKLNDKNVAIVSLTENIDTATPAGRMYYAMLGVMGQLERELIQERVKAGLVSARSRGRVLGRPAMDKAKIKLAKKLLNEGSSYDEVASTLGVGKSTLYKYIPSTILNKDLVNET